MMIMNKNANNINNALINYRKKNKQLNITISNSIYELFIDYCKQLNVSKKDAIEKMITDYIENH